MKKTSLGKAIRVVLGATAMLGIPTQANAINFGTIFTGEPVLFTGSSLSISSSTPYKAWSDYGADNYGWVHTVNWKAIQIGSVDDMATGKTYDVNLNLTGTGTSSPLITGGFTIWTSGTAPLSYVGGFHTFNQVRGPNDGGVNTNNQLHNGYNSQFGSSYLNNIIDGHDGWVGYAQNGVTFTNADGDTVAHGGAANLTSGVVSGYSADVSTGSSLTLSNLAAGYYLLAIGGVCPDNLATCQPNATGGNLNRNFTLTVSSVPLPAAAWLFGGAMASLGFSVRRNVQRR